MTNDLRVVRTAQGPVSAVPRPPTEASAPDLIYDDGPFTNTFEGSPEVYTREIAVVVNSVTGLRLHLMVTFNLQVTEPGS